MMAFDVVNGVTGAINGVSVEPPKTPAAKPVKKDNTEGEAD